VAELQPASVEGGLFLAIAAAALGAAVWLLHRRTT